MASTDGASVETIISANPAEFVKAMDAAASAAKNSSKEIDAQFRKISDTFASVQKAAMGWVAVAAGGGALKGMIKDAADWNGQAAKMATQLGITTQQASVLNVALQKMGLDSDTYTGAAEKLSKQIHSNGDAFETLGVKVQDATGQYRPVTQVMGEVNAKLAEIKNPIEQNIAGQQVYGKGWSEVRGILKITTEAMGAAEQRARDLGLIVGPEGAAMAKQYKASMTDLNLVGKSLELQFGNVLLPIFSKTGAFMASEGPAVAKTFGAALEIVVEVAIKLGYALKGIGTLFAGVAAAVAAAVSGNFAGAKDVLKQTFADVEAIGDAGDAAAAKFKRTDATGITGPEVKMPVGPHYNFKSDKAARETADKKDPGRMPQWEAELEEKKLSLAEQARAEGTFREMSKAEELAFWESKKGAAELSATEEIALRRKIAADGLAINKQDFEAHIQTLTNGGEAMRQNYTARITISEQVYREIAGKYGAESKEAQKAYGDILALRRQLADQQRTLDASAADARRNRQQADVDIERTLLQEQLQMGQITKGQELQAEEAFEARLYAIRLQGLQDRAALIDPQADPVAYDQAQRQIEQAEQQHQQRMTQIRSQQRLQAASPELAVWKGAESAIQQGMDGLLTRTKTLQQSLANIYKGIFATFVQEMITKPLAQWAMRMIRESVIYKYMAGQQVAAQTTASTSVAGIKSTEAGAVAGANAVEAGSGAAASQASIPFAGPVLALAAMAAVFAAVKGLGGGGGASHSASGGFDIPSNLNPVTQLHAREMVLPAKHADTIRQMGEMAGGSAEPGHTINYHDNSGRLTQAEIRSNAATIARELSRLNRGFFKPAGT